MRPNILYLAALLSTRSTTTIASAEDNNPSSTEDDLRPSIWCTAAFLYPSQDRLEGKNNNKKNLKNVFHGFCGLKGSEVSTDIDLDLCLENVDGEVRWRRGSGSENGGISDCECRSKRNVPLVVECQCPVDDGGNKKISSVNLDEQLAYKDGTFRCFGNSGKTEDVSYRLPGRSTAGGAERVPVGI